MLIEARLLSDIFEYPIRIFCNSPIFLDKVQAMKFLLSIILSCLFSHQLFAQGWTFKDVDQGSKPSIELTSDDKPVIAFMLESNSGFVKYAEWLDSSQSFSSSLVEAGYYYGPLDLALDQNDEPHIVYHNHSLNGGDQAHATRNGGIWNIQAIAHTGHDGWDNAIVVDENGLLHVSAVDPSSFGGPGVEYAFYDGNNWSVEAVGTGGIMYAHATSIDVDSVDDPHITYYNDVNQSLGYAVRKSGIWLNVKVDSIGDVGRYSSMELDDQSLPHISYLEAAGNNIAYVKYASFDGVQWSTIYIDTLTNLVLPSGVLGARRSTSLDYLSDGTIHIAYSDKDVVKLAKYTPGSVGWTKETIVDVSQSSVVLGQLVTLRMDSKNNAHLTYYEQTSTNPLSGNIKYATNKLITGTKDKSTTVHIGVYPNPVSDHLSIELGEPIDLVEIIDLKGKVVKTILSEFQNIDLSQVAKGSYTVKVIGISGEQLSERLLIK